MTRPEHPTHIPIEQLSAFLDQQLTPQEQALFDAHLHACEQCRLALADLRSTVALVRALPQPALPRAFTLPLNVTPLPIQTAREERDQRQAVGAAPRRQPAARSAYRRSLRFVSVIAATLGLLFILSGLWSAIPFGHGLGGGASETTSGSIPSSDQATSASPHVTTPSLAGTRAVGSTLPGQTGTSPVPAKTPVPNTTHPGTPTQATQPGSGNFGNTPQGQTPSFTLPSLLDLSTIQGRLSLGLALAVVGIIGLLLTRRRYRHPVETP